MSWGVATQNGVSVSLASIVSLSCGATEFSPASLFTSGVAGAWYDPSDINNYTAGLGPEQVTNGDFSGGSTGWTTTGTGWSIGSGIATHTGTVSGDLTQVCLTVGKTYKITATITGTGATVYLGDSTNLGLQTGSFSTIATCAGSTTLRFRCPYDAVTIDDISVKEVTTIANATLFQDSAGTTPVTAVEQPVGLMLDKSQGLVLGSERVGATWLGTDATWSQSGSTLIAVNGTSFTIYQAIVPAGFSYRVTFEIFDYVSGTLNIRLGNAGAISAAASFNANGTYTMNAPAAGDGNFYWMGNNTFTGKIRNISVKLLPGNHASQATAASRPVLRARYNLLTYSESNYNNGTFWELSSSTFSASGVTDPNGTTNAATFVISAGGAVSGYATLPVTAYAGSIWLKGTGNVTLNLMANGYVSRAATSVTLTSTWTRYTVSGSTQAGDTIAGVRITSAAGATVDVYGRQLVYGSSAGTYQRIAAATDYATAGFLPYLYFVTDDSFGTNSIDFTATDKMSVCAGLTKLSDASQAILYELSTDTFSNNGAFLLWAPGSAAGANYYARVRGSLVSNAVTGASYAAPITNVATMLADIAGDSVNVRLNGTSAVTSTSDLGTGNFGNWPLFIGRRNNASLPFNGNFYQLVVVGKTLSASELASTEAYVATKTGVTL